MQPKEQTDDQMSRRKWKAPYSVWELLDMAKEARLRGDTPTFERYMASARAVIFRHLKSQQEEQANG